MRVRGIAFVATLALTFGLDAATAATSTTKCVKLGATKRVAGKTLICSKVGTKLVWKVKSVVVVAPKPTPTSTPTPTPTVTQSPDWAHHNSKTEIVTTASQSFTDWAKNTHAPSEQVHFRFSPQTPQELVEWIPKSVEFVGVRVPSFVPPQTTISIAALSQDEYLGYLKELYSDADIAIVKDQYRQAMESGAGGWSDHFVMIWNLPKWLANNILQSNRYGLQTAGAHEYFHIFQFNAPGCGLKCLEGPRSMPMWFVEGGAAFVQFQSGVPLGFGPYSTGRQKRIDVYRASPVNATVPLSGLSDGYAVDPYGPGLAATELLVSKIGMEKYLKIYTELGTHASFPEAFQAQAGISLDDFYALFESIRAELDFPRSTT